MNLWLPPSFERGFARNKSQSAFPTLWDGLEACWEFSLGPQGPNPFDFSGKGRHLGISGGFGSDITYTVGKHGWAVKSVASAGTSRFQPPSVVSGTVFTWEGRFKIGSLSDSWEVLLTQGGGNGIWLRSGGSFWAEYGAGGNNVSNRTVSVGEEIHAVFVSDGTNTAWYFNAVIDASSPQTEVPTSITFTDMFSDSSSETFDGHCYYQRLWSRALTPGEIQALYLGASPLALRQFRPSGFFEDVGGGLLTDLIAHWKLDETSGTRADSHGSNDLTDNNTAPGVTGKIGNAVECEFSNDEFLSISDNADLSLGSDTPFTLAFWFQAETLPGAGATRTAIAKSPASSGNTVGYWVGDVDGDKFRFRVANGSSSATLTRTWTPTLDTWYFVVVWHDPTTDLLYMQVDNDTPTTQAWSGGTQDDAAAFCIGTLNGATSGNWDGLFDSVSFWKRVLTDGERTSLYNGGSGLDYDSFGGGGVDGTAVPFGVTSGGRLGLLSTSGDALRALAGVVSGGLLGLLSTSGDALLALTGVVSGGRTGSVTVSGEGIAAAVGLVSGGRLGSITATGDALVSLPGVVSGGRLGTVTISTNGDGTAVITGVASGGRVGSFVLSADAVRAITGVLSGGRLGTATASNEIHATAIVAGVCAGSRLGIVTPSGVVDTQALATLVYELSQKINDARKIEMLRGRKRIICPYD